MKTLLQTLLIVGLLGLLAAAANAQTNAPVDTSGFATNKSTWVVSSNALAQLRSVYKADNAAEGLTNRTFGEWQDAQAQKAMSNLVVTARMKKVQQLYAIIRQDPSDVKVDAAIDAATTANPTNAPPETP